jgi:7-cyano-7-deazaguanine synthase
MRNSELLLLSGGMDSIAIAAWRRPAEALTIDYGQVCANAEIRASQQVCLDLGICHQVIRVDCGSLGCGDLAGKKQIDGAPATEWWPFRNQLLVTLAAMYAMSRDVKAILLGTVKTDAFHIDGSAKFIEAIDGVCAMQEGGLRVLAPGINMSSVELVRASGVEMAILAWAHSCHVADFACGRCRGCQKHRGVMEELGYGSY